MKRWYKGFYAGIAPIWIADPEGDCYVDPRGIFGQLLLPLVDFLVEIMIFILTVLDKDYVPAFPMSYYPDKEYLR